MGVQGSIVGSVAFGTISVCPRYLLSSEVGLVQLLETVLGPFWVWLAGFESPPILTLYGRFVLLLTLTVYFSYTMYQDKVNAAALEGEGEKGRPQRSQMLRQMTQCDLLRFEPSSQYC